MFDTEQTSYEAMLRVFWEGHDPTQGMRQGNDVGTQYRSGIYWKTEAQRDAALASREMFQAELSEAGFGRITTEIVEAGPFFYAEDYHQQYLEANPNGYCGIGGTGVSCPIGLPPARASHGRRPGQQLDLLPGDRRPRLPQARRCAIQTGMIESRITKTATTLTIGTGSAARGSRGSRSEASPAH